jgi:predicted acetyltransferase
MPPPLTFTTAHLAHLPSFRAALAEAQALGEHLDLKAEWLESYVRGLSGPPLPGRVPETVWWALAGGEYLGRVSLRHTLTRPLQHFGHIGYEVRPDARGRGHAHRLLAHGLRGAAALGLPRVLLVCREDNAASRRVIEAAGGLLENAPMGEDGVRRRRYWIGVGSGVASS